MSIKKQKKSYQVQKGDTLSGIALELFDEASLWKTRLTKKDGSTFTEQEAKNIKPGERIYYYPENKDLENNKSQKTSSNVTHRELVTFSNLTNLEWQFVNLGPVIEENEKDDPSETYHKLNDLLSNPKSFVSGYRDPEKKQDPIYEYGEADEKGNYKTEIGLAEMRQEAGIAMEYLEKEKQGNEEGGFLKEWEVVYGADSYKIVKDYIDNLFEVLSPYFETAEKSQEEKEEFYLSREEIAEAKQKKKFYEIGFKVFAGTLELIIAKQDLDGVTKKIEKGILSNVIKEVSANQLESLITKTDSIPLRLLAVVFFSQDSVAEMFQGATAGINNGYEEKFKELKNSDIYSELLERFSKEELAELQSTLRQNVLAQINQKLTMSDTGFRVVVLKKDKNLVIAYKGSRPDEDKLLPEEFNHLQIVYAKMKRKHSDCSISFTGYNAGADLGFLNTLFADEDDNATAKLFYSDLKELKGYFNFTPHDVNKSYKSNLQICIEGAGGITKELATNIFNISLIAAGKIILDSTVKIAFFTNGLITLAVSALIWSMVETIKSLYETANIEKIYNRLIDLGFIEAEKNLSLSVSDFSGGSETVKKRIEANKIEGYIQDEFIEAEYIEVELKTGETLKVNKADALYLLLNDKKPQKLKDNIYVIPYQQRGEYNLGLEKNEDDIYSIKSRILPGVVIYDQEPSPLLIKDKEELAQGQMFINLMEMIYKIQRSYKNKRRDLFEFIYPTKAGIRVSNSVPSVEKIPEDLQASHNEYIFMPYIEKDGNINKTNPQLRDDYIASVFKSMLQKYKEIEKYTNYNSIQKFDDGVQTVKYGLEEYKDKYWHDFVEISADIFDHKVDIDKKFVELMKKVKCSEIRDFYGKYERVVYFNYYEKILQQSKETPQLLERYYKIEKAEKDRPFKDATHKIILHPDYKNKLEYKYNQADEIIGGNLKLYVKVEEETKDDIAETIAKQRKAKQKAAKSEEPKENKFTAEADQSAPSSKFKRKKKLINDLNKTSPVGEIKQAAEIVINEARRKKYHVIAESLEDYLSCMYNTKKINDKKLKKLDAVKTAEVELKLKIEENLVWKLNDIMSPTRKFEPYEKISFALKESRLVHPIGRTIEEFLHPSKKSILRAKASFVLKKVLNKEEMKLKGKLSYRWENDYRWLVGRKKLLPGYGYIDDYQFKKLADKKMAKPYKMYSEWEYYLEDRLSLLKSGVNLWKFWKWSNFAFFPHLNL